MVGHQRLEGMAAFETLAQLYSATRLFVNFFQPSFKIKEKVRVGARVTKRYHTPETPCSRLLAAESIAAQIKTRLLETANTLDPLQLLEHIRNMQQRLASIAAGGDPQTGISQKDDLTRLLASLATAWHEGEMRPTHRSTPRPPRHWRTRKDPFEAVWPTICLWLEEDPDQTGKALFARLQREHPDAFPDSQLRSLQRRLKEWRGQRAHRLVFGAVQT